MRRFARLCCAGLLFAAGSFSSTACDKFKDTVQHVTSEGTGNEGISATNTREVLSPEQALQRALNLCRNYAMGESSKPNDLNGVKKLCREKKAPPLPDKDPWGNELIYEPDPAGGNKFKLYSAGPDGKPGNSDDLLPDADQIR